jgi:hypothetical protein
VVADPDLARVVDAWPDLPPHIRAAVLALVGMAPLTALSTERPSYPDGWSVARRNRPTLPSGAGKANRGAATADEAR